MKVNFLQALWTLLFLAMLSCAEKRPTPAKDTILALNLKKGALINCGPSLQLGSLAFSISADAGIKDDFNLGLKLLHSFEYDEAEKVFARIIDQQPACAMAYWGIAMSNFHPLWTPPAAAELTKGAKAIALAGSLRASPKEADYIRAVGAYYEDWEKTTHRQRCLRFEQAMEKLHTTYPDDQEAAILYALALNAAADPADKTFQKQEKAAGILQALWPGQPNHPGIVHYLIHTYDVPALAARGLTAARKYAAIAPSSSHALHMPSHIFTRLGLWDECIQSNLAAASSAQCYAQAAGLKGHWDEELHALDYLMYGYLQKGDNKQAKQQLDYLATIKEVAPMNFKVAYAFAAIPARFVLENKLWPQAAGLQASSLVPWNSYPWQEAIVRFTRLIGAVHTGAAASARAEWEALNRIHDTLLAQKDSYKANQVQVQIKAGEAWILFRDNKKEEALQAMQMAAELEDKTEKHPVTPGEVIPAREQLGDLLLAMNRPQEALKAYETDLERHPNRFNGLYGAGQAAAKMGDKEKATQYYRQLLTVAEGSSRPELQAIKARL